MEIGETFGQDEAESGHRPTDGFGEGGREDERILVKDVELVPCEAPVERDGGLGHCGRLAISGRRLDKEEPALGAGLKTLQSVGSHRRPGRLGRRELRGDDWKWPDAHRSGDRLRVHPSRGRRSGLVARL